MKELALALNVFGAVLGSLVAGLYGVRVWLGKERANVATWSIILFLDVVGLYLAYETGNHEPYIQIGWCIAAGLIVIAAWHRKGDWSWTRNEIIVVITCGASVGLWLMSKATLASLLGYLTAAYISVWPQAKDYLRYPDIARKSAWLWQVSIVAILFPLVAKFVESKYGIGDTLIYYALIVLNVIMAMLCMRRVS